MIHAIVTLQILLISLNNISQYKILHNSCKLSNITISNTRVRRGGGGSVDRIEAQNKNIHKKIKGDNNDKIKCYKNKQQQWCHLGREGGCRADTHITATSRTNALLTHSILVINTMRSCTRLHTGICDLTTISTNTLAIYIITLTRTQTIQERFHHHVHVSLPLLDLLEGYIKPL